MTRYTRRQFIHAVSKAGLGIAAAGALGLHPCRASAHQKVETAQEMILIPGGPFIVGLDDREGKRLAKRYHVHPSWLASAVPRKELELPDFYIDKYPVTNAHYFKFVLNTGAGWVYGKDNPPPEEVRGYPAVSLNCQDAADYAVWAGKRLPTEEEWEKAARGQRGFLFPWGNNWDADRCFCNASHTASGGKLGPVDAHPNGSSPYGVMDMAGNCCEWTSTPYGPESNVVKGGFFRQHARFLFLSAYRNMSQHRGNRQDYIGFRCAKSVEDGNE